MTRHLLAILVGLLLVLPTSPALAVGHNHHANPCHVRKSRACQRERRKEREELHRIEVEEKEAREENGGGKMAFEEGECRGEGGKPVSVETRQGPEIECRFRQ
jgi:hypothetical protein